MSEGSSHWLVDAVNHARPGTLPPEALSPSVATKSAWRTLNREHGLSDDVIATAAAASFGAVTVDTKLLRAPQDNPFPEAFCRKLGVVPFDLATDRPIIATCDPRLTPDHRKQIRFLIGRDFELAVISPDNFDTALTYVYSRHDEARSQRSIDVATTHAGEPATVQLAKAIFRDAIDKRASDIHIHPFVGGAAIRFRIDGILARIATVPKTTSDGLANYLNVQANLDPNPFIPQDGRLGLRYGRRHFDVRLSLLPAFDGMRIVCRLLEQGRQFSLQKAGFSHAEFQSLKRLVDWGSGIVLLTGPTGSGKTSTLYALLTELNTSDVNILTLEDPVEYVLPGISQVQVNDAQGRSFADTLRAVLRQDPDIVLVGEIRDGATARIAAQASMTGHLVLSTLHTNDAIAAIPRLVDLGLDPTSLADSLVGVVSQRLLRKLCTECKVPVVEPLQPAEAEFLRITRELPAHRASGCTTCSHTGYLGRIPVTEILEVSPAMRNALLDGARDVKSLAAANHGFTSSMAQCAARRIVSGDTTPDEAWRELGLRFWNELATSCNAVFSGTLDVIGDRTGRRPGILLVSDDQHLADALANTMPFEVIAASSEISANAILKENFYIHAIVVDASLLTSDPSQWLASMRTQLAWSGIPVLFLLREGADELRRLLATHNAEALLVEDGHDATARVASKLAIILGTGIPA